VKVYKKYTQSQCILSHHHLSYKAAKIGNEATL